MSRFTLLKKFTLLSLTGCFIALPSVESLRAEDPQAGESHQEVLDGLAAVVNGDVITFSQVRELVAAREDALRHTYANDPKTLQQKVMETRMAAVNDLIDRQLILQEFKKNKYNIPDYVVDDRVQTIIREQFGGNRAAFIRTLDAQGYTLDHYREIEQDKIIVQAMRQKELKSELIIPPHDVEEYYAKHHDEFATPDQVKLRMIVLKKQGATDATQKAVAEEIRQKVASGADFANMAQLYSQDSTNPGGDWGWIDRKTLNEQLTKIAFGLKAGQMSGVVDSGDNYYILYVDAKKNGGVKAFKEVRDDIEKKLTQDVRQQQQEKWMAKLRKKAYIKTF
ncbi:MAG: peptidyl-prolyl cis-trans isomerase [Chthoniobacteraceae bacterium]